MKKFYNLLTVLAIAAVSLSVTSCYDDYWDHRYHYWDYDYCYRGNSYCWNRDYEEVIIVEDINSEQAALANALLGEWEGDVTYQYTDENGQVAQASFGAIFTFDQFTGGGVSLSGTGTEMDYDIDGNTQILQFAWYVDELTSDIYLRYADTGKTFVMDIDSEYRGFSLNTETGVFMGYAFGTNNTDMLYFELLRTSYDMKAKSAGGSTSDGKTFGSKSVNKAPVEGPVQKKLIKR